MSGIERLRALAGAWDEWGLGGALAEIADEIERERAEDCYRMGFDYGTVWRVVADMERHCLGHEGMEDSPVARWARELREALKSDASDGSDGEKPSCPGCHDAADATFGGRKVTRDPAEDVSMSAYDLLPQEDRDALAWVRDHGGLDHVRVEWRSRVPRDLYQRKRWRLLGHIAECETALGRRNQRIEELAGRVKALTTENAELRKRAMPEGFMWPRYEDGTTVCFGDEASRLGEVFEVSGICLYRDGSYALNFRAYSKGERVKRPEEVLAADGEPLEVGQTVWHVVDGRELTVTGLPRSGEYQGVALRTGNGYLTTLDPTLLTHQRPVLDADGVPIKVGDTVYFTDGREQECNTVVHAKYDYKDEPYVQLGRLNEAGYPTYTNCSCIDPSQLTHAKPEPHDTWERVEEDARGLDSGVDIDLFSHTHEDIVRRCRALAERERGEA